MGPRHRPVWKTVAGAFIGVFGLLALFAILFPVLAASRPPTKRTLCLSRMKQTAIAMIMYAGDHDDRFPPASTWADAIVSYARNGDQNRDLFRCPELEQLGPDRFGHAFYGKLGQVQSQTLVKPSAVPMIFDAADLSWNANGGLSLLPVPGRHPGGLNEVAFANGYVRAMTIPALFDVLRSSPDNVNLDKRESAIH